MIISGSNSQDKQGTFTPAPEGQFQAVCVDYVDYGMCPSTFNGVTKEKHKIGIVFQIDAKMENGGRFLVTERFTASLHEKGKLLPFLEQWKGRRLSNEELAAFDLENLIGANAYVQIVHNEWKDSTFANINSIMPVNASWNLPKMSVEGYVRRQDREGAGAGTESSASQPQRQTPQPPRAFPTPVAPPVVAAFDDDIPF